MAALEKAAFTGDDLEGLACKVYEHRTGLAFGVAAGPRAELLDVVDTPSELVAVLRALDPIGGVYNVAAGDTFRCPWGYLQSFWRECAK